MGSKFSKRKKKTVESKHNLRNADSTQSLNTPGHDSVTDNPNLSFARKAGSTPSLNFNVYGNVYTNPDPNAYTRPDVTHTLTQAQSAKFPIAPERRRKTQQAQTIAVFVQTENNECVPGIQQKPNTGSDFCHNEARIEDDLSSKKRDIMKVIHDEKVDGRSCVKNFTTGREGRVPTYHVQTKTSVDVESQKYFFQLNKKQAEDKLLEPEIEIGTYLLRRCTDTGAYTLSLRCENEIYELDIKHYKIRVDDNGVCYIDADSIVKIKPFSSIMELIKYYREEPGLRCKLKTPLPQDILLDDLAVKFSDLQLGKKLGPADLGSVYAGTLHKNKQVAVKCLKAGGSMSVKEFRKEAETMHKLRHPNIVSLLAICEGNDKIYIITEKMSKGDLLTLLREDTNHTIKFTDLMDMAIQVVEGMCYLEKKGFVHRDLRAAKVLVGDGNITKIADFGLAKLLNHYYEYEEKKGTALPYKWTAPEAIRKQTFTVKTDVWSFGILLYEMVTYGDVPYAAMPDHVALEWLERGNRLKIPTEYHCPSALCNIMLQCWKKKFDERPNFECIKEELVEIKTNA